MKYLLTLIALISLLLCGCGGSNSNGQNNQKKAAYTVSDSRGKQFSFAEKPQRIVSTSVFVDEMVLDLVDHKRIAGLSKWVHDPGLSLAVKEAEDVKTIIEPNVESVLKAKPDLVLLSSTTKKEFISGLEDVGLKVFLYTPSSRLDNIGATLIEVGKAVGEPEKAEAIVKDMNVRMKAIKDKASKIPADKRRSALLFLRFGAIGGEGTIYHDIIEAACIKDSYENARKGSSVKGGTSRILSKEEVVKTNPDFFIMGSWSPGGNYLPSDKQLVEIYNDPAFANIPAVKNKHAYIIHQSYVNSLSQHAVLGVEKLYSMVYEGK